MQAQVEFKVTESDNSKWQIPLEIHLEEQILFLPNAYLILFFLLKNELEIHMREEHCIPQGYTIHLSRKNVRSRTIKSFITNQLPAYEQPKKKKGIVP